MWVIQVRLDFIIHGMDEQFKLYTDLKSPIHKYHSKWTLDGSRRNVLLDNSIEFGITSQLTLDLITSYNVETQLLLYIFINIHSIPKWATEAEAKA